MKITKKLLTLFLSVMLLVTGFSNNVGLTQVLANDNNPNDNPYLWAFNEISGHTGGVEAWWNAPYNYSFNNNDTKSLREDSPETLKSIGLDCSRGTYAIWARGTMKKYTDSGMTAAQASAQVARDFPLANENIPNAFNPNGWDDLLSSSDKFEKVYSYDGTQLDEAGLKELDLKPGAIILFNPEGTISAHWSIVLAVVDGDVYTGDLSNDNKIHILKNNVSAGSAGTGYIYKVYNVPQKKSVSVQINKSSASNYTSGNKLYSLEGAEFDVYIDGNYKNKIGTLTTDKNGKASATYTVDSSVSKLWVKETKGPNNYLINDDPWTSANVSSSNKATFNVKNKPANDPVIITLEKEDPDAEWVETNGIPSLAGAQFTIKYYDNTNGDISGTPKATWVIESKKRGEKYLAMLANNYLVSGSDALYTTETGIPTLPIGTISIQETKAPEGYTVNGEYFSELAETGERKTLRMNNGIAILKILRNDSESGAGIENGFLTANNTYTKEEKMIYGGFKLQKRDITSGQATPLGGASLGEVVVELYNDNSTSDAVNGISRLKYENQKQTFNPGELMLTLTADENGLISLPGDALSAGKYRLVEKTAPKGYLNEGVTEVKFTIENDGEIVDLTKRGNAIENKPMRGDVSIRKIREDNQKGMAGIQFEIKSNTTGETHIITTDENGFASTESAYAPHTKNTNSGEAGDGVWFGLYKLDGSDEYTEMVEPDDSVGALPFDTYTITELRGENNKDVAAMYTDTFSVYADKRVINLGNIENTVINLRTKATNEDGKKIVPAVPNTKLIDTVTIQGLTIGNTYTISGVLMDKETGEELVGEDNQPITASKEFKATAKNMEVEVLFRFDASVHGGKEIVVFETLKDKATDTDVARHEDLEDEAQTVTTPEAKTTAKDTETGEHTVVSRENVVIEDVVKYKNFEEGKSYVVQGTLMNKATGEKLLDADGKEIVSEPVKFRAGVNGEGEVTIKFEFNGVNMKKITAVAFEEVTYQDNLFAVHADLDDPDQTVYFPEIGTVAIGDNNTHNVVIGEKSTIVDTVKYTNVDPNATYVVKGQVYDKTAGELIEGAVAESEPFVPGASEGEVEVTFIVDTSERAKHELVIFEELYLIPADETKSETPVAEHKDPEDKDQTVFVEVPEVEKYINKDVHEELELFREEFTYDVMGYVTNDAEQVTFYDDLVDILEFVSTNEDVQVSVHDTNDHTVHGTVETEGTPIDAQVTINNQSLEVFIENATEYRGKWIKVTFDARIKDTYKTIEALKRQEGQWLVIEDDINVLGGVTPHEGVENTARYTITVNNEGKHNEKTNTVTITPPVPEIKTSASNAEDGTQQMLISKEMHIIDKVMYRNVEPGDYKLYGTLMIKKTGKPVQVDGKDLVVVKEVTVAEDEREGVWEMDFEFNGYDLEEGDLVVFEKLTTIDTTLTNEENPDGEEVVIAEHADMNDGDQTIILTDVIPEIGTKATFADGKKSQKVGGVATVNDTVTYKGLRKGETYVMKGTLMDKETGKSISKAFTVEFTAEARDGEVVVPIKVDTKGLGGKTGVVFEECYRKEGNIKIAEHKDINDEAQTVFFIKALLTKIVTGSSAPYLIGSAGLAALVLLYFVLKKKSDKKD